MTALRCGFGASARRIGIHAPIANLFLLLALASLSAACLAKDASNGQRTSEETAVLATTDRYLAAISADDQAAMKALQTPDGMTYRASLGDNGRWDVRGRPNSYYVDPANKSKEVLRERYWSPTAHVRGAIAVVWAPYEFWIDGKTSHCGVDAFDLIKTPDGWLIANAMWTVEPDACEALRPADASILRPAD